MAEDRHDQVAGAEQAGSAEPEAGQGTIPAARRPAAADQAPAARPPVPAPRAAAAAADGREQDGDGDEGTGPGAEAGWRGDGIGGLFGSRVAGFPDAGGTPADGIGGLFGSPAGELRDVLAPAGPVTSTGTGTGTDRDRDSAGASASDSHDRALADTNPDVTGQAPPSRRRRKGSRSEPPAAAAAGRGTHARNGGPLRDGLQPEPVTAEFDGLSASLLLPQRRRSPAPGWRRGVYRASAGFVRVPPSSADASRRDMISRARTPVATGHYRIAVLSLKGGVGKTTITMGLGSTLAAMRGDRVIAVDANPDRGTLSDKLAAQTTATIRDLLDERNQIHRYADVRNFTSQAPSRLEVLASAQDPAATVPFGEQDYRDACAVLERYYSICITDCGSGLLHSAMAGVLRLTDQIVLVSTASVDGARSASACMDWLAAHGHHDLVRNGVVVVTAVRRRRRTAVDLDLLEGHFAARCRAVTVVPYDPYLAQGAEADLDQLRKGTATAFLKLAAVVGDGFTGRRPEQMTLALPPAPQR